MLTRPHTSAPADATQTAAVFSLLGLVLGALVLLLVLGLFTLNGQVQKQAEALEGLTAGLKERVAAGRTDLEAARVAARAEVLEALLREVRVGDPPERFLARYERAVRERDEARLRLERGAAEKDALYDYDLKLKRDNEQKDRALRDERERVAQLEKEGKELKAQSDAKIEELGAKLDEQLERVDSYKAGDLTRRYNRAWYVAAGGLLASGLLGVGLVVALARGRAEDDADQAAPPAPKPAGGESPHEIT